MSSYKSFLIKIKAEKEMQNAIVFAKTRRDVIKGLRYARESPFMPIDDNAVDKVEEIRLSDAKEMIRTNKVKYLELPSKRIKLTKVV